MKMKTSVTLSREVLDQIDAVNKYGNRSLFIEKALWQYIEIMKRTYRDINDLEIINQKALYLNEEAEDVLKYQIEI